MDQRQAFYEAIAQDMTATLATAAEGSVTMRLVSPVPDGDGILIFTHSGSVKYRQLKANPNCCLAVRGFFAEATATFCGSTMLPENRRLREVYSKKFSGAFDEGIAFGGRDAEFLLLRPFRLSGWRFADDAPGPEDVPTVPFSIAL